MKKWMKWNKESAMIIILAGILCLVVVWPSGGNETSLLHFTEKLQLLWRIRLPYPVKML